MVSLITLQPGQFGKVVSLNAERAVDQRLMALGLLPGMVVKVVRRAPLGDPLALSFGGIEICLRESEAREIFIDVSADCPVPRPQKPL